MKRSLFFVLLSLPFLLTSCYTTTYGPGYTSVGVGVGYYDTLPVGWGNPYYHYNNRYYYGGNWETGRFYNGGRYYPGRYYHQGRYFYGGNYYPHSGHSGHSGHPGNIHPVNPRPGNVYRPRPHFPL